MGLMETSDAIQYRLSDVAYQELRNPLLSFPAFAYFMHNARIRWTLLTVPHIMKYGKSHPPPPFVINHLVHQNLREKLRPDVASFAYARALAQSAIHAQIMNRIEFIAGDVFEIQS
eukprot:PhF_6_TR40808/c0_g1_i5/m.61680